MGKNHKTKSASNIYYGFHVETDKMLHVSDVPSGKGCNCICATCREPLEAKKGTEKRHHFAHVANDDCVYGSEIAVYRVVAQILENTRKIRLPTISFKLPNRPKSEFECNYNVVKISSVSFQYSKPQYPPLLKIISGDEEVEIQLNFDVYTKKKECTCSVLVYRLPKIEDGEAFTEEKLKEMIQSAHGASWYFNRVTEHWRQKYMAYAPEPKKKGSGYECPISKREHFWAAEIDCVNCSYNLEGWSGRRCLAMTGISDISDFDRSQEDRLQDIEKIRLKNEEKKAGKRG